MVAASLSTFLSSSPSHQQAALAEVMDSALLAHHSATSDHLDLQTLGLGPSFEVSLGIRLLLLTMVSSLSF
jgi:hypothetical protein